ncbi:PhzF family phenazine biosynthesis protein [Wenyingzhuangia sp. IMCC45467]
MKKIIYQVDAFTKEAFKGNPAGVMILNENLNPKLMQDIANEMNLSETAFVNISEKPFEIRYFTPTTEIPLCGHATLASAHILYENNIIAENEIIQFKAKGGDLEITKNTNGIKMVFPKYKINKIENIENFEKIIGFTPIDTYSSENNWIIAISKTENEIKQAKPVFNEMGKNGLGHLMITSLSERENIDFVVRCFAPISGINEDPVTGSAQCALVPVWNLRTKNNEFKVEQISERTGQLNVKLVDNQVEIIGNAITIFKAEINIR